MEFLENILSYIVEAAILMFEYVGVAVIIFYGIRGIIMFLKHDPRTSIRLAHGLSNGLEFLLGGEILRTVVAQDLKSIAIVGAIIVMRVALTLLIHWEIRAKEKRDEASEKKASEAK